MEILRLLTGKLPPSAFRFALKVGIGTVVGAASCAPLLGLEEAVCDPQDSSCDNLSTVPGQGSAGGAGQAGAAMTGNAGSDMGGAGMGGAGMAGSGMGGAGMGGSGMGGSGMGGSGMGGSGLGGAGAGNNSPECVEYCAKIEAVCTTATGFQQYTSPAVCLAYCALFDLGDAESPGSTNTVACRMEEVIAAEDTGEFAVHCPTGGPGGNGVCGTNCEGYCSAMTVKCGDGVATYERFADVNDCLSLCADVPDLEEDYSVAIQDEDSVQCRLYHVTAATVRPESHCNHAAGEVFCLPGG